jgi:hypothetical protein
MINRFATLCRQYDPRRIPWVHRAFALSIGVHALALLWGNLQLPLEARLPVEDPKKGKPVGTLAARLAPPALRPSSPPGAAPAPSPSVPSSRPRPQPRPQSAPPVLAAESPARAEAASLPAEPPAPPAAAVSPPAEDLAAYVAARQRAREAANAPAPAAPPSPPGRVETERERHNRAVAANLGLDRTPTFMGGDRLPGGGMFQLQNVTSYEAELIFFGWNKDIRRNARQVLSVRRGSNPSIEIALVRRMIAIIREHESGDFVWESTRLGRNLTLSARVADNAGLEDVLMYEFFPEYTSRR